MGGCVPVVLDLKSLAGEVVNSGIRVRSSRQIITTPVMITRMPLVPTAPPPEGLPPQLRGFRLKRIKSVVERRDTVTVRCAAHSYVDVLIGADVWGEIRQVNAELRCAVS